MTKPMWRRPIKAEGERFPCDVREPYVEPTLQFHWCWLRFVLGVIHDFDFRSPRGQAVQWRSHVSTCYMRLVNMKGQLVFDHIHDLFDDPFTDSRTGELHKHTVDGSLDPWTKRVTTPESSGCWCVNCKAS